MAGVRSCSISWLNSGSPERSCISRVVFSGSNSLDACNSAVLNDPLRVLPERPRMRTCDPSLTLGALYDWVIDSLLGINYLS